jgi:hypothetical protein
MLAVIVAVSAIGRVQALETATPGATGADVDGNQWVHLAP